MLPVRAVANLAVRSNATFLSRGYHDPKNFRVFTMNDMPVPDGDFFKEHRRKNRFYNTVLAVGVVSFVISMIAVKESGLLYCNYSPPKSLE
ncbi:uncharacterized protein LOC120902167 [Anopheles arabiensis]|uniref:Deltamethrin resistance protein prag01 domain-containing protein n=1 Tax=Anopheles arabiensis TaxID=7173 RepID=A0A182HVS0_ANOAR|nr:uncharacterized protein LOC120902167 [Anopheles arabiensis]